MQARQRYSPADIENPPGEPFLGHGLVPVADVRDDFVPVAPAAAPLKNLIDVGGLKPVADHPAFAAFHDFRDDIAAQCSILHFIPWIDGCSGNVSFEQCIVNGRAFPTNDFRESAFLLPAGLRAEGISSGTTCSF
jgi:hypothetical protein